MMTTNSITLVEGRASPATPNNSPPPSRDGHKQVSPANSDDSSFAYDLSDLSFNYERDQIVRVSKRHSKSSSSPPTPVDSPPSSKAPSPVPAPPLQNIYSRPAPLTRSESLPQESVYQPRHFQRAVSGPLAITPAGTVRGFSALATSNAGTGRKIGGPRRVRLEDLPEGEAQPKPNAQTGTGYSLDEKENQRAARALRPTRPLGKPLAAERISEVHEEPEPPVAAPYGATHFPVRPRRSASLSDTPPLIDPGPEHVGGYMRPGNSQGARRVTIEEKFRQEREIAVEQERGMLLYSQLHRSCC